MKIQIKSDLHMEFRSQHDKHHRMHVNPEADVLILAGDIITSNMTKYLLEDVQDITIPIFYIAGNHEYYGSSIDTVQKLFRKEFNDTNIIYLNKESIVLNNIVFICATMWTNLNANSLHMTRNWSDFNRIKDNSFDDWNQRNRQEKTFIFGELWQHNHIDTRKVVVTHYLPSDRSTPQQFKNDPYNCFFVNDCEEIMRSAVAPDLWIHGHTHDSFGYNVGKTYVACNPYGYEPNLLNPLYDDDLIIEI